MATIPFSNPAGNNQMSPPTGIGGNGAIPIASPGGTLGIGSGSINSNPYSPIPTGSAPSTPTSPSPTGNNPVLAPTSPTSTPSAPSPTLTGGYSTNVAPIVPGGDVSNNLQKQLTDIYGQGVGASLFNLLNNMSGTDSTTLQEYIASLAPSFAQSQSTVNATLGEQGVGKNSSVNAIAQSNLQSQENADIAGESASLTQSQEQLTAQILEGTEGASTKEVAASGFQVLGDVLGAVGNDAATLFSGTNFGSTPSSTPSASSSIPYSSNNDAPDF